MYKIVYLDDRQKLCFLDVAQLGIINFPTYNFILGVYYGRALMDKYYFNLTDFENLFYGKVDSQSIQNIKDNIMLQPSARNLSLTPMITNDIYRNILITKELTEDYINEDQDALVVDLVVAAPMQNPKEYYYDNIVLSVDLNELYMIDHLEYEGYLRMMGAESQQESFDNLDQSVMIEYQEITYGDFLGGYIHLKADMIALGRKFSVYFNQARKYPKWS